MDYDIVQLLKETALNLALSNLGIFWKVFNVTYRKNYEEDCNLVMYLINQLIT